MIEWHDGHLVSNQGQPTTQGIKFPSLLPCNEMMILDVVTEVRRSRKTKGLHFYSDFFHMNKRSPGRHSDFTASITIFNYF